MNFAVEIDAESGMSQIHLDPLLAAVQEIRGQRF